MGPCRMIWSALALAALFTGPVRADPVRSTLAAFGDREIVVLNRSGHAIVELYVSPQTVDAWGQDRLGEDVLDIRKSVRLKLGRLRDCTFDLLAVYDDTSREEARGINVCQLRQVVFDASTASKPAEPPGPSRSISVVNASARPIQQLYVSPPDAAQWGEDRLTQSALSVGEQREVDFKGECTADVRVVFANRAAEERRGLDLCANPVLKIEPGWTTKDRPDTHD